METIKTEIEWRKPEHEAPPFNTKILVMLGGASGQIGMPLKPYTIIQTVTVSTSSESDEYEDTTAYEDYKAKRYAFHELQFRLIQCEGDDDDDECGWPSDCIVAWAQYPADVEAAATRK